MNSGTFLSIDYGTKTIGLAYSVKNIITPLPSIPNDSKLVENLLSTINTYNIDKIYIGVSEGRVAKLTLAFVSELKTMLKLPIETVEESVSTIEAAEILKQNRHSKKVHKKLVDSVSAAVILRRVIG